MTKRNQNRFGYKYTRAGWIPKEWDALSLSKIARVVRGSSPRPAGSPVYFNGDFIPWLTVADLTNNSDMYLSRTLSMLTKEGAKLSRIFPKGTLLLANSGATLGVPKILDIEACGNDGIAGFLDLNKKCHKEFVYHFLSANTAYFRDCLAPGMGQPNLNTEIIGSFPVPLPPLPEQKRTADILSAWDRAIELTGKLIEAKRRLKKGLMQRLLTGRIRFPEFGPRNTRKKIAKNNLPDGWRVVRLCKACQLSYGKDWKNIVVKSGGYPVYGTGGEIGRASKAIHDGPAIIIGRKGTIDSPIFLNEPFWAVDTTYFATASEQADTQFLFYLFSTIKWRRYNEASGVPSLSRNTIEHLKISLPLLPEQHKISSHLSAIDREIHLLTRKRGLLQEQKKGLMQKLLSGEIRVKMKK